MPLKQLKQKHRESSIFNVISYRIPLPVIEVLLLPSGESYSICPRCDSLLEREYMGYCDCCGQCLAWKLFDHAKMVNWPRKK